MTPLPPGTRFRHKQVSPTTRLRLAYKNDKILETKKEKMKDKKWVEVSKSTRARSYRRRR